MTLAFQFFFFEPLRAKACRFILTEGYLPSALFREEQYYIKYNKTLF